MKPSITGLRRAAWLAMLCLVVLGAKLRVVQLYGSDLPFWDQWVEAEQCFHPWRAGQLTAGDLFAPHNEHRILFTRLLDLGVIWLNGRWSPLLQMTVNAFLHAGFACMLAYALWSFLGRKNGWLICLLLAPFFALPYAAENTLRGFHSQQYFLGLTSLAALAGLGFARAGSRGWWLGLLAAVAGLFTMGSGFLAPLAVAGLILLRTLRQRRWERSDLLTLGGALAVGALGLALGVAVAEHRDFRAQSIPDFLAALARNLTWPFLDQPAMIFLVALPLVLLAVAYFRPGFPEPRAAEFLLGFGLWGLLQSAALAYGRASYGESQASRYMDVLNVIAIASMFAAWVWSHQSVTAGRLGRMKPLLPLAFAGVMALGLWQLSVNTAETFLKPCRMMSLVEETSVRTFIAKNDPRWLFAEPAVRPNPELVLQVLRDPALAPILPLVCRPESDAPDQGRLSGLAAWLRAKSLVFLLSGLGLAVGLCAAHLGSGKFRHTNGLAGAVMLLALLAALGGVWSKRALQREVIERDLHRELATEFRSAGYWERAAAHQQAADRVSVR